MKCCDERNLRYASFFLQRALATKTPCTQRRAEGVGPNPKHNRCPYSSPLNNDSIVPTRSKHELILPSTERLFTTLRLKRHGRTEEREWILPERISQALRTSNVLPHDLHRTMHSFQYLIHKYDLRIFYTLWNGERIGLLLVLI